MLTLFDKFRFEYPAIDMDYGLLIHADAFEWLARLPEASIHAVVTDPPYGVKEFETEQIAKRDAGVGGVWRIPPAFDGHQRAPLPRFTAFTPKELETIADFFKDFSRLIAHILKPGGHLFLASNSQLSQLVFGAVASGGLEFRGEIIRLVRTSRGGIVRKTRSANFPMSSHCREVATNRGGCFASPCPLGCASAIVCAPIKQAHYAASQMAAHLAM